MATGFLLAAGFGGAAAGATVVGGMLAIRLQRSLNALLSFGSGVVLGVALLDLFPEALELGEAKIAHSVTVATALCGFVLYLAIARLGAGNGLPGGWRSQVSVASLIIHSVLDGFGIGSAFHASAPVGIAVAAGVVAHDLVDGANTVVFSLDAGASQSLVRRWLLSDGAAPMLGILLSAIARPPEWGVSTVLALMTGGFTYIGASVGLRPIQAHAPLRALGLSGVGMMFVFIVVQLAHG
jgi:ZIP family zinc transporter